MNRSHRPAAADTEFLIGDCRVLPRRGRIERGGRAIRVKPKAMAVLQCLVQARGEVVSRAELFDAVWGRAVVSDAALTQCIVELRSALGDTARASGVIETVPRVGFRLTAPIGPSAPAGTEHDSGFWGRFRPLQRSWPVVLGLLVAIAGGAALVVPRVDVDPEAAQLSGEVKTLAILPLLDMSPAEDQQYLADGITEELIHGLSLQPRLRVVGRTTAFMFKNRHQDLREIGRMLQVDHILEGSVRKSGDRLRVTVNLVEAASGAPLWSRSYERSTEQYFEIQDELTQAVIAAMAIEAGLGTAGHVFGTTRFEAYEYVMKAIAGDQLTDSESVLRNLEYLRLATEIDPDYAFAWAALSRAYSLHREALSPEWWKLSGRYIERALSLDSTSPQLLEYAVYHYVAVNEWAAAHRALSGLPEDHHWGLRPTHLELLVKVGRAGEAMELGERLLRRDPLSGIPSIFLQHAYAISGMTDKALEQSELLWARWGTPEAAQEAMLTAFAQEDASVIRFWLDRLLGTGRASATNLAMAERFDNPEFALEWLRQAEFHTPADRYVAPAWAAYLGDPELALQLMRQAPDPWAFWMPYNARLRQLEGFRELVQELGLVDYWRKYGWGDFCRPAGEEDFECDRVLGQVPEVRLD